MVNIIDIEGIGPKYAAILTDIGINTVEKLLKEGATPKGRKSIAERSGISYKLILQWVNFADLFRIKGVGEEYSELLERSGVDTVVELATRNPDNLYAKVVEVNKEKKLVRKLPTVNMIKDWIEQAKKMDRVIEY